MNDKEQSTLLSGDTNDNQVSYSPTPSSIMDLPKVEQWATERGLKEHHLKTIYQVVMNDIESTTTTSMITKDELERLLIQREFPKKHAAALLHDFTLCSSKIVEVRDSALGGKKLLVQLQSGKMVETVMIPHERRKEESNKDGSDTNTRYTVCVSSQVGCAKSCTFCATGTMGLLANLSSAEILEQVWLVRNLIFSLNSDKGEKKKKTKKGGAGALRNVVFMGMGEPLDNYDAVHEACRGLTHQCLFGLQAKHVTISTVGDVPNSIRQLADEAPQISLALSLHGATQSLRTQLVPTAKRAPLIELENALDYHYSKSGQGAMLEYLLIDGVNDDVDDDAQALVDFCLRRRRQSSSSSSFVNLIPYNPTVAGGIRGYQTPTDERIHGFHQKLRSNGIRSLIRWSSASGRDADGACGQLVIQQ